MSAPDAPEDHSVELANIEAQKEREAREAEALAQKAQENKLQKLRTQATVGGRANARQYFQDQGLDSGQYANDIESMISSILSGISPDDPNPGSYFKDVGARAYTTAEEGARNKELRSLDKLFPSNFDTARISDTLDDPFLAAIEAEQYQSADDIIKNMLARGVITDTGYQGARKDLEGQRPGVRSRLAEFGNLELAGGRKNLRDIANEGRSAASQLKLGTDLDEYGYATRADASFNDWLSSLGDRIRGKVPGNLFSTDDLAAIAGRSQGGQNTQFNANALAGIAEDEEDEDDRTEDDESIF